MAKLKRKKQRRLRKLKRKKKLEKKRRKQEAARRKAEKEAAAKAKAEEEAKQKSQQRFVIDEGMVKMLAGLVDTKMKQEFVVRDKMLQQLSGLMKNIQGQIRREKVARDVEEDDENEDNGGLKKRTVGPRYTSRAERTAANARISTKAATSKPEPPRRDEDGKVQPDRVLPRVAQTSKVEVRKHRAKKEKRAAKVSLLWVGMS